MRFDELPPSWQDKVRELRDEAARYRLRNKVLRTELAALRAAR